MKSDIEKAKEWWNSLSDTERGYAALYFKEKKGTKAYKILHKPTGLYYIPDTGRGNLSIKGKIYANKPVLSRILDISVKLYSRSFRVGKKDKILIEHFKIEKKTWGVASISGYLGTYIFPINLGDLEIIEL